MVAFAPGCRSRPRAARGGSSVGRALRSQCRGRGFESLSLHYLQLVDMARQRECVNSLRQPPVEFSVALFEYHAELAVLVSAWPGIPESLKADIQAMVRATGDTV